MVLGQDVPSVKPHLFFCYEVPSSNQKQGSPPISSAKVNLPHWPRYPPTSRSWPGLSLLKACPWLPCAPKLLGWVLEAFPHGPTYFPVWLHHLPSSRPLRGPCLCSLPLPGLENSIHKLLKPSGLSACHPLQEVCSGADCFLSRVHTELVSLVAGVVYFDGEVGSSRPGTNPVPC